MAGSAGSIYVDLLLRDGKYSDGLNRARRNTQSFSTDATSSINKTGSAFSAVLNPVQNLSSAIASIGATLLASLSVEKLVQYADTWKQVSGRLSIVASGAGELAVKQEQLFRIAQETRQPLADIVNFYSRLNQFIPESVRGQYDLLGVTKSVTTALAITGESTISAQNAMIQFTQGIGTNFEAAGAEIRSIQELAPRLAQAIANAFGDGERSLSDLQKAGVITRDSLLKALRGVGPEGRKLADELAKLPTTVAQSFTRLDNAFLKFIGQSDAANSATSSLAMGITALATNFETVASALTAAAVLVGSAYSGKAISALAAFAQKQIESAAASSALSIASIKTTADISQYTTAVAANAAAQKAMSSMAAVSAAAIEVQALQAAAGTRMGYGLAKATQAAAGANTLLGTSTVIVNSAGVAVVARATQITAGMKAAAIATTAFGAASRVAASAMALMGGPIGVALIATYTTAKVLGNDVSEIQKAIADNALKAADAMESYADADDDARKRMKANTEERIRQNNAAIESTKALIAELEKENKLTQVGRSVGASIGVDIDVDAAKGVVKAIEEQNKSLEADKVRMGKADLASGTAVETKLSRSDYEKTYKGLRTAIEGVDAATIKYQEDLANLEALHRSGLSDKEYEEGKKNIKRTLDESTEAFRNNKAATEDAKRAYDSFYRSNEATILGVTDAQLKYNQVMSEAGKYRSVLGEEAYNRIMQEQKDILNGTADAKKELETTYTNYEAEIRGVSAETIEYEKATTAIKAYAEAKGFAGTQQEKDILDRVKKKIEGTTKETETWAKRVEQISEQAARNMQDAFADFLFDPFKDGVGGMAENFAIALRKMAANLVSSKIFEALGSYFSKGATPTGGAASTSGGGFLSAITGMFDGFFAEGGTIKPGHWGVAGEAGAELVYGGNTGATVIPQGGASGGGTVVNIINNTGANVSATSKNNGSGVDIEVMIDEAVAKNMSRSGSRTSQAMNAYSSRTLVRR